MRHALLAVPTRRLSDAPPTAFFAFVLLLGAFVSGFAQAASQDRVVLITIDGLAAFYLSDPQASLPTLRRLASEGAQAEALRVANPSTTWPNHTTLITGVYPDTHSVLFNGKLVRGGPGQPVRIEAELDQGGLIAVPTIYDQLHRLGYHTAAINWPCTRGGLTLDDNFPDTPDRIGQTTPRLRAELIRAGILDDAQEESFAKKSAAAHDQTWTAAARHILQARPPNLLLLHLLSTDVIQHRYGPQSPAAYSAIALADAQVGEVLRELDTAGLRDQTTLFIASDHGFARPSKLVNPNVILRKAGLQRPAPRRRAQSVSEGGTAFVYLTAPATAKEDRSRVIELLRGVEGIARILEPGQYGLLHLPEPARNPQMGDLLLVAEQGYTFSDEYFEDDAITSIPMSLGSHGYLATDPRMNGVLIAWGRRIKPGTKLGIVDAIDVAPTIASLLGQALPGVQGKVLQEMLSDVKQSFTTHFEGAEVALSEGGAWTNRGADWTQIRKANGLAFGTQTGTNTGIYKYNDSYAHLSGFPPDQEAWGQVHITKPTSACTQELEILLRWNSSPHRTTGYECFARCVSSAASYVQIVRWDGPLGKFTYLADLRGTNYGLKDGDILKASVIGNRISVYINGVEKAYAVDDSFNSGNPGIGEFLDCQRGQGVGSNSDFGFASFTARAISAENSKP